jgi:hypothetical protein
MKPAASRHQALGRGKNSRYAIASWLLLASAFGAGTTPAADAPAPTPLPQMQACRTARAEWSTARS